ncbi:unnamed protein product, partial [Dovyalis caffra]
SVPVQLETSQIWHFLSHLKQARKCLTRSTIANNFKMDCKDKDALQLESKSNIPKLSFGAGGAKTHRKRFNQDTLVPVVRQSPSDLLRVIPILGDYITRNNYDGNMRG